VCDKRSTEKKVLSQTARRHTEENLYSCTQCQKRFPSQRGLHEHMIIHTGKHKCLDCGKCCRSSYHLARHRRSHSGEKLYKCSRCETCFSDSSTLQRHKRSVHGNSGQYLCPPIQSKCGFNPLSTIPCVLSLMMLYLVAVLLCQPVSNC